MTRGSSPYGVEAERIKSEGLQQLPDRHIAFGVEQSLSTLHSFTPPASTVSSGHPSGPPLASADLVRLVEMRSRLTIIFTDRVMFGGEVGLGGMT